MLDWIGALANPIRGMDHESRFVVCICNRHPADFGRLCLPSPSKEDV